MEYAASAVVGVVGGLSLAGVLASLEHVWFHLLLRLESKGLVKRLAPSIPVQTMRSYKAESFWAVALPPMPLIALVFIGREVYLERCHFSWDIVGSWVFTWTVMVLHDAHFWMVHSLLHKFKRAYRRIHQRHHQTNGDLTVFSTAYGDVLDIGCTITSFYCLVLLWMYVCGGSWNPLAVLFLMWSMNNVDLLGHCGYWVPAWVYVPASLGVLLTPFAQRPKHHYIHHLDPRFNRSLYFTWWDRLGGTFRDEHPKVKT